MNTLVVLLASLVAVSLACVELDSKWEGWKVKYSKTYENSEQEMYRRLIWENAHDFVEKFNTEGHSHTVELNHFADMTNKEFRTVYLGFNNLALLKSNKRSIKRNLFSSNGQDTPSSVDWRNKNVVTAVKNQGQCGSCWAFSTTGSIEGQYAQVTQKLLSFSEQQLVDCSGKEGNDGCNGGLMDFGFKYAEIDGLERESDYRYVAVLEKTCRYNATKAVVKVISYTDIKEGSSSELISACAEKGPISVAMDAGHMSFQLYKKGVYDPFLCSSKKLDHGVLMVGYNMAASSKPYYIIKNSWGAVWGMEGYFYIAKDKCGIETSASYPTIKPISQE